MGERGLPSIDFAGSPLPLLVLKSSLNMISKYTPTVTKHTVLTHILRLSAYIIRTRIVYWLAVAR